MSCTPNKKDAKNYQKVTKREDGTIRLSHTCVVAEGKPRTEQSHKHECDIKNIVRRYAKMGVDVSAIPTDPNKYTGEDYVPPPDYTEAMRIVATAESYFHNLPAKIRDRFKNDPAELVRFCQDEKNLEEAVGLGILKKVATATTPSAPKEETKKAPAPKGDGGQPKGGSDQ